MEGVLSSLSVHSCIVSNIRVEPVTTIVKIEQVASNSRYCQRSDSIASERNFLAEREFPETGISSFIIKQFNRAIIGTASSNHRPIPFGRYLNIVN